MLISARVWKQLDRDSLISSDDGAQMFRGRSTGLGSEKNKKGLPRARSRAHRNWSIGSRLELSDARSDCRDCVRIAYGI